MINYVTEIRPSDDRLLLLLHRIDDSESVGKQTHVVADLLYNEAGLREVAELGRVLVEAFSEIRMQECRLSYANALRAISGSDRRVEAMSEQAWQTAINQWLELGEGLHREAKGFEYGYFSGNGWAAKMLREHRDSLTGISDPAALVESHAELWDLLDGIVNDGNLSDSESDKIRAAMYRAAKVCGVEK